ncbi:MAG: hypothetical protein ACRDKI_10615 [Solirubrobacterales bacterium]
MNVPIAHAGHWLAGLLYLAPVIILAGGIGWQRMNDRRNAGRDGDDSA